MDFLAKVQGKVICVNEGERLKFASGENALKYLRSCMGNMVLKRISVEADTLVLEVGESIGEEWIQKHVEQFGKEPNLFDGV